MLYSVVPQMSLPPSLSPLSRLVELLRVSTTHVLRSTRGIAFWTAIALPFSYLPLFTLEMVEVSFRVFVVLLLINVVALIVGHSYRR